MRSHNVMAANIGQNTFGTTADITSLMVLFEQLKSSGMVNSDMLFKAKEYFVLSHHERAITQITKGKKEGRYKTYIGDPRRQIESTTYQGMIERLYVYYTEQSGFLATFSDAIEWLVEQKKIVNGVKPQTLYRTRMTMNRFTTDKLAGTKLQDIRMETVMESIRAKIDEITAKSQPPALSDVGAYLAGVHEIFTIAMSKGIVNRDPCINVKRKNFKNCCEVKSRKAEENLFTLKDLTTLLDALLEDRENVFSRCGRAAAWSGMRGGELPALRWTDIQEGFIHVHSQQLWEENDKGKRTKLKLVPWTKNENGVPQGGRRIPMIPELKEVIEEMREYQQKAGCYSEDGFVFCNPDGSMINKDSYEQYLNRICTALGFSTTNNHALRKGYNSHILISRFNLDLRERAKVMGHSEEVNLKFYTYTDEDIYTSIGRKAGVSKAG